jgi:rhodanese-related sulfurtransferase
MGFFKNIINFFKNRKNMQQMTVAELKSKMDNKESFLLLDVREPAEYQEFNLKGQLVPLGSVQAAINRGDFDDLKDKEIVVHCRSGQRSMMAQMMFLGAGFTDVKNLTGGVMAWQQNYG